MELVGLCASALRWLADLHERGLYPHAGVTVNKQGQGSYPHAGVTVNKQGQGSYPQ